MHKHLPFKPGCTSNQHAERLLPNSDDLNIDLVHSILQDKLCELPDSIVPMENTPVTSSSILENLLSGKDDKLGQESANLDLGASLQMLLSEAGILSSTSISNAVLPVAADTKRKN